MHKETHVAVTAAYVHLQSDLRHQETRGGGGDGDDQDFYKL